MVRNKDEFKLLRGFQLRDKLTRAGFEFNAYQKEKFDMYIDDGIGENIYIRKQLKINTNILWRLTLPFLLVAVITCLAFNWLLTGKWGFLKISKIGSFLEKWENKL